MLDASKQSLCCLDAPAADCKQGAAVQLRQTAWTGGIHTGILQAALVRRGARQPHIAADVGLLQYSCDHLENVTSNGTILQKPWQHQLVACSTV